MVNKSKKILVLGSFGYDTNQLDGQTIKTRQVYNLLKEQNQIQVDFFCSQSLRKKPYKSLTLIYKIIKSQTIVVIYASSGGFQTMLPIVYKLTRFLYKKIIYIAIGSSQVECIEGVGNYTKKRFDLLKISRNLDGFLVETSKVKNLLISKYNFKNVEIFPNFRHFNEDLSFSPIKDGPLKLVFMSRITPNKGYDVAFNFFEKYSNLKCDIFLDFYGPLDGVCNDDFFRKIDKFKHHGVQYKGVLQPYEIYPTLRQYDVMLFPTRVDGIPGSIIDAYISSLTVIATNWTYAHEIIDDKVNGFIVPYDDPDRQKEFDKCILTLYNDRKLLNDMKLNAFNTRSRYSAKEAWKVLEKYI